MDFYMIQLSLCYGRRTKKTLPGIDPTEDPLNEIIQFAAPRF